MKKEIKEESTEELEYWSWGFMCFTIGFQIGVGTALIIIGLMLAYNNG